jgi:hypothetical protein
MMQQYQQHSSAVIPSTASNYHYSYASYHYPLHHPQPGAPHQTNAIVTPQQPIMIYPQQDQKKTRHSNNGATKKRKVKKNKILIPVQDMIRLFSMPQPIAAVKLNVSISTLKRRFYELEMEKWPANHTLEEFHLGPKNPVAMSSNYHNSHPHHQDFFKKNAGFYSLYKEPNSEEKMEVGTLLNAHDTADEKHIDPMTSTILNEAFKCSSDVADSSNE